MVGWPAADLKSASRFQIWLSIAAQIAQQETNNLELLQKYIKLDRQIKLISQLD